MNITTKKETKREQTSENRVEKKMFKVQTSVNEIDVVFFCVLSIMKSLRYIGFE
jgi:hypothetical protein